VNDEIQTIRDDLAFMKGLAMDTGRLPGVVGAHFALAGLIYGPPIILGWAALQGLVDLPTGWVSGAGLWCTIIYVPVMLLLIWKGPRRPAAGSATGRAMAAAWAGMGLTTITIITVVFTAGAKLHEPQMWQVWCSICFALWGAGWFAVQMLRPRQGWIWVALGSYAQAVANGFLIQTPYLLLALGVGILLWLGGPGLVILIKSRGRLD
jgi:hypothetical protein